MFFPPSRTLALSVWLLTITLAGAERSRQAATVPVSIGELVGADVVLQSAGTEPVGSGSTPRGEEDPPAEPKGKVNELVLATQDGQIVCAALSVGGIVGKPNRVILVSTTAFEWATSDKKPRCVLRMTKGEIDGLPEFDVQTDGKEGLDRAVEQARGLSGGQAVSSAQTYVLSSQLKGCDVRASDKAFAKVQDAAVDVAKNWVGYLIVSHSGIAGADETAHVVPLRACRWTRVEGKSVLKLEKTGDQLKSAPEYRKPPEGIVTLEQMKAADAFFGGSTGEPGALGRTERR